MKLWYKIEMIAEGSSTFVVQMSGLERELISRVLEDVRGVDYESCSGLLRISRQGFATEEEATSCDFYQNRDYEKFPRDGMTYIRELG